MLRMRVRLVPLFALLAALSVWPAFADDAGGAQVRTLIQRQLDAFEHGDAEGAFALASPGIRTIFSDSATFMDMVRNKYAPVYHHRSAEFGALSIDGDKASQEMTLIDDHNDVWTAVYKLERQADGSWLITGCFLIKSSDKSA